MSNSMRLADMSAAYSGLMTVCGMAGRPDIAVRLTYAMSKDNVETNETHLQCYEAGKRRRASYLLEDNNEEQKNLNSIPLAKQFESILAVECLKYVETDQRRSKDKKIRIIL